MLTIRLQRTGRRNRAAFRVVATESTTGPKSAKHLEVLGSYDPHNNTASLKKERITNWLANGAQASDTVHNLLVTHNVIPGPKRALRLPKKEATTEQKAPDTSTPTAETATDTVTAE